MSEYFNSVLFAKPELPRHDASIKILCPDRLMSYFESLGDGCELGNVQRFCGIEPLGLLRFSSMPYRALIELLDCRFEALKCEAEALRLLPHGQDQEWWVSIEQWGIFYHTGRKIGSVEVASLKQSEAAKLRFLRRKLLEELDAPEVIFVRRDPERSLEEIRHAFRRLNAYGPHALLWVASAPEPEMIGEIEMLEPGLLRGFIGDTGRDASPPPAALAVWLTLAEKALEMLKPEAAAALRQQALPHMIKLTDPVWRKAGIAATVTTHAVPPLTGHHHIFKHTLLQDSGWENGEVIMCGVTGLVPDMFYVVSAWVWLPPGFEGGVSLVFPGTSALRTVQADVSITGTWQRIATSMRLPDELDQHSPGLYVSAGKGTFLYSTAWRFDQGVAPGDCF